MVTSIRLQNFRLYKDSLFEFEKGINIIVGPNACGKTSLIEGILVLSRGGSYRVKDPGLINFKKKWARLEGYEDDHSRDVRLDNQTIFNKTIVIDGKEYKRLNLSQKIPLVLFEPNDLLLLSGSPENRRDYLDNILGQNSAGYKTTLNKYNRALAQRNALLKNITVTSKDRLFPWNIRLSELGGQITSARQDLINYLNSQLPPIYRHLSVSNTRALLEYKPQIKPEGFESSYLNKLDSNLVEDITLGFTRFGPHRDDFGLLFNSHPSAIYASRGEMRTATLALKLAELEMLSKQSSRSPLFLLDDVFSELDGQRRKSLAKYLVKYQSFITTTDADIALKQFSRHCNVIPLSLSSI